MSARRSSLRAVSCAAVVLSGAIQAIGGCDIGIGNFNLDLGDGGLDLGCHDKPPPHMQYSQAIFGCGALACEIGWGDCNAASADGCETSLTNDGANCGRCAIACTGGRTCGDGSCFGAETIATVPGSAPGYGGYPFAIGGGDMFVSTLTSVVRLPKTGGDAVSVAGGAYPALVADADGAYWLEAGGARVWAWRRGEAAASVVATPTPEITLGGAVGVDASHVYVWGNSFPDGGAPCRATVSIRKTGGPLTLVTCADLQTGSDPGGRVAVGSGVVYWLSGSDLMQTPAWRGPPLLLAPGFATGPIAASPRAVYGATSSSVSRFDTLHGTIRSLWTTTGTVRAIVADATAAYVLVSFDAAGGDDIVRVSESGDATVLAGAQPRVGGMAIDGAYFYFSVVGDSGAVIRRVPKAP